MGGMPNAALPPAIASKPIEASVIHR